MGNGDPRVTYDTEQIDGRDVERSVEETTAALRGFFDQCIGDSRDESSHALRQRLNLACGHFLPHYAKSDCLAMKYQTFYTRGSLMIYSLSVLSVTAIAAQSLFSSLPHGTIMVEVLAIIVIIFIIRHGNKVGWHRRWVDYRFLAERFRFAVFIALAGQKASLYCTRQDLDGSPGQTDWVFRHFGEVWRRWEETDSKTGRTPSALEVLKDFIGRAWLYEQKGYHQKKVAKHLKKHRFLSSMGEILFALTLLAAVLHLAYPQGRGLSAPLAFAAIVLPAAGAAFSGLRAHFEHNRLARRSERMTVQLERLQKDLSATNHLDSLVQVVREAEALMLHENAEWHVLVGSHRLQPLA